MANPRRQSKTFRRPSMRKQAQSGQAIVLIALMMVGLIGMTGLALDGGSLLLLQRRAQKVADIAALSATIARCDGASESVVRARAEEAAEANDVDGGAVDLSFISATDIEVIVRLPKDPYFIHLVYDGPMTAQGRSVARCTMSVASTGRYVIQGLSEVCYQTVQVTTSNAFLDGSILSMHDTWLNADDSELTGQVDAVELGPYLSQDQGTQYIANWTIGPYEPIDNLNGVNFLVNPLQPDPLFTIDQFQPGGDIYESIAPADFHVLNPSVWYSIDAPPGSPNYIPREGVIYMPGDFGASGPPGMNFESGPRGLTIVMEGAMNFSTDATISIEAFTHGLAIFSNKYNTPDAHTNSGSEHCYNSLTHMGSGIGTFWRGLIYAPGGFAQITTAAATSFYGAIVANVVRVQAGDIDLIFEGNEPPAGKPNLYYLE